MKWKVAILASVVLNTILLLWGHGTFIAVVLAMATSFWIGLPLLLLSAVGFAIAARKNLVRLKKISACGIVTAFVIFSTLLSIPAGKRILADDLRMAQAFCEELIPIIEQHRNETGSFPQKIVYQIDKQRTPRLIDAQFYQSDGTNYYFIINDPGTIMGGFEFSSDRKEWCPWD